MFILVRLWYRTPWSTVYSRSKIFAVERSLCISEIICASKLCRWAVSAKIYTLRKLSVAKVNKNSPDKLIAWRTADCSRQVLQLGSWTLRACRMWGMPTWDFGICFKLAASIEGETLSGACPERRKMSKVISSMVSRKSHHVQVAINSKWSKFSRVQKISRA